MNLNYESLVCYGEETLYMGNPDQYGNPRSPKIVSLKHHWWWMMNTVWDGLKETRGHNGHILFIEEDHFIYPNAYRNLQGLVLLKPLKCPDCYAANLAPCDVCSRGKGWNSLIAERMGNIGYAFNQTVWRKIHRKAKEFCFFDDYNWDITMWANVYPSFGSPLYTLRGSRTNAYPQHPSFPAIVPVNDVEQQQQQQRTSMELEPTDDFNYSKRSQWLRAAVLGANDGLVSTASLMMGVGAVKQDIKAMILTGFAGLVAGACSMAIGEFVSVYSQLDIELAQMKRDKKRGSSEEDEEVDIQGGEKEDLPNPLQASAASALAFSVGAMVPLLAASFIKDYKVRVGAVIVAVTLALIVFGWLGAVLGKAPTLRSAVRVLVGGWLAMAITFGLTKLIGSSGL